MTQEQINERAAIRERIEQINHQRRELNKSYGEATRAMYALDDACDHQHPDGTSAIDPSSTACLIYYANKPDNETWVAWVPWEGDSIRIRLKSEPRLGFHSPRPATQEEIHAEQKRRTTVKPVSRSY